MFRADNRAGRRLRSLPRLPDLIGIASGSTHRHLLVATCKLALAVLGKEAVAVLGKESGPGLLASARDAMRTLDLDEQLRHTLSLPPTRVRAQHCIMLVLAGGDVRVASELPRRTLLHFAVEVDDEELLVNDDDLLIVDYGNGDALLRAVVNLGGPLPLEARDSAGHTALTLAAAAEDSRVDYVHILKDAGADVNARRKDNMTALMHAVYSGHKASATALLRAGADIHAGTEGSLTALSRRASLTALSRDGSLTALSWAAIAGQTECLRLLLNAGARMPSWHVLEIVAARARSGTEPKRTECLRLLLERFWGGADEGQELIRKTLMNDALDFLRELKTRFANDNNNVYRGFLEIMKLSKSSAIDTADVIEQVKVLFAGHPDLISYFNSYLPMGEEIAI